MTVSKWHFLLASAKDSVPPLLPRGAIYSPSLVSLLHMQRSHLKPFSEVLMSQTQSFLSNIEFIIAAVINGSYLCFA